MGKRVIRKKDAPKISKCGNYLNGQEHPTGRIVALVTLHQRASGYKEWIIPICPFCGYEHYHSGPSKESSGLSGRSPHCSKPGTLRTRGLGEEYVLVEGNSEQK